MLQAADMGGNDAGTRTGGKGGVDHSYTVILNGIFYSRMTAKTLIIISVFSSSSFGWYCSSFGWSHFFDRPMTVFHDCTEIYPGMPNKYQPCCCLSVCTCTSYSSTPTWTSRHGLLIVLSLNLLINSGCNSVNKGSGLHFLNFYLIGPNEC